MINKKYRTNYSSNFNVFVGYRVGKGKDMKDFIGERNANKAQKYARKLLSKYSEVSSKPLYKKGRYSKVTILKRKRRRR